MRWFDNIALQWKLILVKVLTTTVALMFAGAFMTVYNSRTYESYKTKHIAFEMNLLGAALSPALSFDDQKAAELYLAALKADREIEIAALYRSDGKLFSKYVRAGVPAEDVPENPKGFSPRFTDKMLESAGPIEGEGGG